MDPSKAPSQEDGQSSTENTPPLRRRLSMEEDLFYQHIMSAPPRRPSQPPPYQPGSSPVEDHGNDLVSENDVASIVQSGETKGKSNVSLHRVPSSPQQPQDNECAVVDDDEEELPGYSSSIFMEGIFGKKHEIENTTKRAEDRQWHNVAVTLNGTALNIYNTKKDWGWGRTRDGPSICPDNPPWVKRAKLEKSYSLLHADAGIAADYDKRRYVIRIRAETDQFLLSCIELSTFVKWLECLFAAIDVAAPIDERDFPRDMSIPRIQRIRWFQGQATTTPAATNPTPREADGNQPPGEPAPSFSHERRRSSVQQRPPPQAPRRPVPMPTPALGMQSVAASIPTDDSATHARMDAASRLTTSYPNEALDAYSGKWYPEHKWSEAHDMLYAKLCYSNLLFRSPRKSNYIISKGKQWYVDWATGRMVRVLPPAYGEIELFGPWQVIHTENMRI